MDNELYINGENNLLAYIVSYHFVLLFAGTVSRVQFRLIDLTCYNINNSLYVQ